MTLSIVILAAGNGKRMQTAHPKVLHQIAGTSFLERIVNTVKPLTNNINVIYGFGGETVREKLSHLNVNWVLQTERLGTGHAVLQALPNINDNDQVLVLVGDTPLVSLATLQELITKTGVNGMGLVITELEDPTGLGRIIHDQTGKVFAIVEDKDATSEQKKIKDINSGIIIAPAKKLKQWLPTLKNNNKQGEYYLTDIIALAVAEGIEIHSIAAAISEEVLGVNDRIQLAKLERYYQQKTAEYWMLKGVTLLDPNRFDVRGEVEIAADVIIDINVILEGQVKIEQGSYIGPHCIIKNSVIGENVSIQANSVIEGAIIESSCSVGPFARIRPSTVLKANSKIGNFVEVKNLTLGKRSKASHLTYLGDATIGDDVNIGAGTITCNYDGVNKHHTIIEDGVFIGSDTQLIPPLTIGKNATIGAGSTINRDAPEEMLTLSRAKQTSIPGWKRPKKNKEKE
jgi:bifunctional UDP-N-acetylglucosamine pyrophosphorylase/glucosamine-1-phosphate N-acetyltransferase